MNNLMLYMLIILIPILFILAFLFIRLSKTLHNKDRKKITIDFLKGHLAKSKLIKVEQDLNRIHLISRANSNYKELFIELSEIYDTFSVDMITLERAIKDLDRNKANLKWKVFKSGADDILLSVKQIRMLEKRFTNKATTITQQSNFLRDEYVFYSKHMRKIVSDYNQRTILMPTLAKRVSSLTDSIRGIENDFESLLHKGETTLASKSLQTYSLKIKHLASIINEGPSIETYLLDVIPHLVQELIFSYQSQKQKLNNRLEYINFSSTIKNISNSLNDAKSQFYDLNFTKAKKSIQDILKSAKMTSRILDHEISSRLAFIEVRQDALNQINSLIQKMDSAINEFLSLQEVLGLLRQRLFSDYENIKLSRIEIVKLKFNFTQFAQSNDIAYSSKVARTKIVLNNLDKKAEELNDFRLSLWNIRTKNLISINKYRQAEGAINEIVLAIKNNHIQLSKNERDQLLRLNSLMSKIVEGMGYENFGLFLEKDINTLVTLTTYFYHAVGVKVQVAKVTRQLMIDLAPERALNSDLNEQLNISEREFLLGKYDAVFNNLVSFLEERGG